MVRNEELKKYFSEVESFSKVSQEDIKYLLNSYIDMAHLKSQYNTPKYIGKRLGYIDILKYIPSGIVDDSAPLYICYCNKCNSYFLDICKCVINRKTKVCNSKKCQREYKVEMGMVHKTIQDIPSETQRYRYTDIKPFNEKEEKEYIIEINNKYNNLVINSDKFIKVLSVKRSSNGEKYVKILIKCLDCGVEREAALQRWLGKKKGLKLCDCKRNSLNKLRENLSNMSLEEYKKYNHPKYRYLAKGYLRAGVGYIWVVCKDCGTAVFMSGESFLNGEFLNNCLCYIKNNDKRNSAKYLKYDFDSFIKLGEVAGLKLVGDYYTNSFNKKGNVMWVAECPYCKEYFGRDPYSLITAHVTNCGCVTGYVGEELVNKVLNNIKESGYSFNIYREKSFTGLFGLNNGPLRYDYYLWDKKNNDVCLIEFNGKEHYSIDNQINISKENKEKRIEIFERIKQHDKIKEEYAIKNNIPFLVIKYTLNEKSIEKKILEIFEKNKIFGG